MAPLPPLRLPSAGSPPSAHHLPTPISEKETELVPWPLSLLLPLSLLAAVQIAALLHSAAVDLTLSTRSHGPEGLLR